MRPRHYAAENVEGRIGTTQGTAGASMRPRHYAAENFASDAEVLTYVNELQ